MRRNLAWICCLALAAVGCGGSSRPVTTEDMLETSLNDVGNIYRAFVVARHRPPKTLKDLATMERMSPAGVVAVRSGKIVVRFGADLPDTDPIQESPPRIRSSRTRSRSLRAAERS